MNETFEDILKMGGLPQEEEVDIGDIGKPIPESTTPTIGGIIPDRTTIHNPTIIGGFLRNTEIDIKNTSGKNIFNVKRTGANVGDVTIGNYSGGQGILYDYSADTTTYKGALEAGSIHIPDQTTANSFHTETDGDSYWGCNVADWATDNNNAKAYVLKTGIAKFKEVSLTTNVVISGIQAGSAIGVEWLTAGSITSKAITLAVAAGTGDSKIQAGKTDFGDDTSGFIIGIDDSDSDNPKFEIGEATKYLKYDPTNGLRIRGNLTADTGYMGGTTGWVITAGYIKSFNNAIELKGSNTPHIKAISLADSDNYVQMTAASNIPRFDVYESNTGAKLRARLNKDGLYFYDTNGVEKARLYASTSRLELADTFALKKRLLSSSPSDHDYVGNTTNEILSGATVAAFQLVYLGTGGKWLLCDSDAIASSGGMLAIALEAKNDTQAMLVALPGTFIRDDTWNWTVGATLYAGETAGSIQEAIPTGADGVIRVVGWAISADVIWFFPSSDNSTVVA